MSPSRAATVDEIIAQAGELREQLGPGQHDRFAEALYARAAEIAQVSVCVTGKPRVDWDLVADRILTSRWLGFPIMLVGLLCILWATISGANVPGAMLFEAFSWIHVQLLAGMSAIGAPWWLTGFLIDGIYLGLAWVVSVMLPPMMIFFPIFTFLEDVGYLPRVAFNLDRLFRWAGAHGKQAMSMGMGFGCNAAGVIACRIIDSPRERTLAILTNNFMLCNGRWPTIILLSTLFVAAAFPPAWSSVVATAAVVSVTLLGVVVTFVVCRILSKTVLKGESSHFCIELPPYRRPAFLRIIYRSMIDRTVFVLARACVTAAPAGALIWILGNVDVSGVSLMAHISGWLDGPAHFIGLDGVIVLAYIIALPANEIIVPTIIMGYMATGKMTELDDMAALGQLFRDNGWTLLTAACVMLFALLHYPCATTTWTIYRETGSVKWTVWSNLMPLGIAVVVCGVVAQSARLLGG